MESIDEIQDIKEGGDIDALLELDEETVEPVDGLESTEIEVLRPEKIEVVEEDDEEAEDDERDDDILMESFEDIDNF